MKLTIIVIVLAIFLRPVLPVAGYIINYDYIVKELCENKAKPELHCNGKCQLMKELAKASENEKPASQKKLGFAEAEVLFCKELQVFSIVAQPALISKKVKVQYCNLYTYTGVSLFYHPPAIV